MRRLAVVAVLVLALAACSGDDGGGSTTAAPEDTVASTLAGEALTLTSEAFDGGGTIPEEHAGCVDQQPGPNVSPPLTWSGVPDSAVELAVTVVDPDADGFVHWVVAGIDPTATGLESGSVPEGAVEAQNDAETPGYFGPCPPEEHTYLFAVHALAEPSGLTEGMAAAEALAAVEGATELQAELRGVYDQAA